MTGPVRLPSKAPVPPGLEVPAWIVGRPAELESVVQALASARAGTVGVTTGLYGAGGFGKTTLARMVCADRRVRRWFSGRVYLVARLALVSQASGPGGGIALHDVIRDYLRAELGPNRLATLAGVLLDTVAAGLPAACPLGPAAGRAGDRRSPLCATPPAGRSWLAAGRRRIWLNRRCGACWPVTRLG